MLNYNFPLLCGNTFLVSFFHIQTFGSLSAFSYNTLVLISVLLFYLNEFDIPGPPIWKRILWKRSQVSRVFPVSQCEGFFFNCYIEKTFFNT